MNDEITPLRPEDLPDAESGFVTEISKGLVDVSVRAELMMDNSKKVF